jgi:LytS/YehU family sensor histidine kinase
LRYKFQPENVNHYSIKIAPHWWQTNQFNFITRVLTSLLLIFLVFYSFKKREKLKLQKKENERKQARLELKAIYAQLNPHFIFNALNSIQGLINKNELSNANLYLTEFSSLLRESLKNNDKEFIPLNTELKTMETYIRLEQLRFHFNYSIQLDPSININAVEVPVLLLQPLIENAIKHGVSALDRNGCIDINLRQEHKNLSIEISDNGKGFDTSAITKGYGLKLTNERIQLLNQTYKDQPIQLAINSKLLNGTIVHLLFENWL